MPPAKKPATPAEPSDGSDIVVAMSVPEMTPEQINAIAEDVTARLKETQSTTFDHIVAAEDAKRAREIAEIQTALAEPFPKEMLRFHQGKKLTYIPVAEVIARMNRVLGVDGWSSEVVRIWREDDQPDWVLAHVRVTATIDYKQIVHDGVGGQQVKKLRNGTGVVDLGDEYKGAMSDAFKKACQGFGVGIDLARTDDALAVEESYATPAVTEQPASTGNAMADAVSVDTWNKFVAAMKACDEQEKAAVREWWQTTYGEYGNPSADLSTEDQIAALNATISLIRLGAEPVAE